MYKLFLALQESNEHSQQQARRAIERILAEDDKIKGQIAKDLRRLGGDYGFEKPDVYSKLKDKYIRGHQSQKKLAILDMERRQWCKE